MGNRFVLTMGAVSISETSATHTACKRHYPETGSILALNGRESRNLQTRREKSNRGLRDAGLSLSPVPNNERYALSRQAPIS
jgi:hypothetical protein